MTFSAVLLFSCSGDPHEHLNELGIEVLNEETGSGTAVTEEDIVLFHFRITMQDGSEVGSSHNAGSGQTVRLGQGELPLAGWEESMIGMREGGKRTVRIPSDMAFGEEGVEGVIPPNEDLTLELEILEILEEPVAWEYDEQDIQTTESGLQYVIHEEGSGDKIGDNVRARVHYSGYLQSDGSMFFSTRLSGMPDDYQTGIDDFFDGFNEAIPEMREGERRTLIIPSHLAFAEMGIQGLVPPGADIIMDVEVESIVTSPEPWGYNEEDIESTSSGLQYVVQIEGDGEQPNTGDEISVHYSGYLEDGTMFDSSKMRDQPFNFTVGMGQVIRGWDEGLLDMQEGERRTLIIPYNLAYGEEGRPPTIPPRATLIFDVELISVN